MALKALKKILTDSLALNQMQANMDSIVQQLNFNPFVTGQWIKAQKLVSGQTKVQHGLGRTPQGFIITNINGAATVYLVPSTPTFTNPTDKILTLQSSAAVTVDIWVF